MCKLFYDNKSVVMYPLDKKVEWTFSCLLLSEKRYGETRVQD